MEITKLRTLKDWELLWEAQKAEDAGALYVFKLSPICPTSHAAEEEIRAFTAALPDSKDLVLASVDVIGERPVSQQIEKDTGIRHQSPQALLVSRGQNILWNASHNKITEESLAKALAGAKV
jgi:bacillithiol system protein YtxJ